MHHFHVTFEIYRDSKRKEIKVIKVEAGTKKLAVIRAMAELNKLAEYSGLFKNTIRVEEVLND